MAAAIRRRARGDLDRAFGSLDGFKKKVVQAAVNQFGSGYVWLYSQFDGRLAVRATHDAMNPLLDGVMPLLTIDLWEHGYYLDYHNERERYVQTVLDHLVNWNFVVEGREQLRRGWAVNGDSVEPRQDRLMVAFEQAARTTSSVLAFGFSTGPDSDATVATSLRDRFSSTVEPAPTRASFSCWNTFLSLSCSTS